MKVTPPIRSPRGENHPGGVNKTREPIEETRPSWREDYTSGPIRWNSRTRPGNAPKMARETISVD